MDYYSFFTYHSVLGAWVLPAAIAAGTLAVNYLSARKQAKENRKFAEYQNLVNSQMLDKANEYNTPQSQMARYQTAGLNPNLIYGQGTPGNQSSAQTSADFKPAEWQGIANNVAPILNQSLMTQSQTAAIDAGTRQKYVLTRLNELQAQVLARNPLLQDSGFTAIMESLKSSAEIKASESGIKKTQADWFTGEKTMKINGIDMHGPAGVLKMETELNSLIERFHLQQADQKIKSQILQSKEFQNTLLEIQTKWMKDAEITPQHILQFIQMFLLKLL